MRHRSMAPLQKKRFLFEMDEHNHQFCVIIDIVQFRVTIKRKTHNLKLFTTLKDTHIDRRQIYHILEQTSSMRRQKKQIIKN